MWNTIKSLLASKKALVAILSAVLFVAGRWGLEFNVEELAAALAPLWLYIFAQGVADKGKEAAKVSAAALEAATSKPVEAPAADPT